jgi:hypothetical protein
MRSYTSTKLPPCSSWIDEYIRLFDCLRMSKNMLIGAHGFSDNAFLVDANGGSILKISL